MSGGVAVVLGLVGLTQRGEGFEEFFYSRGGGSFEDAGQLLGGGGGGLVG